MAHRHRKNKIVKSILLQIAREQRKDFTEIKRLFTQVCDIDVSIRFWQILKIKYPKHQYTEVSHCPDCGKFALE